MLTHITLGPLTIPSYPFLSLVGLWAGMWLAAKEAERLGIAGDHVYNMGLYGVVAALLGGRLGYVATHWEAYAGAPLQALALTANAISLPAAAVVALAVMGVYARRHRLPLPPLADAIAPGVALALVIGGVGAFLGSQTLGTPTTVPWGVYQFDVLRHPAHLYQVVATLLILSALRPVRYASPWPGFLFLLFVALYAASRLLLDPFFDLPQTIGGGFRLVQVVALAVLVVSLAVMGWVDSRRTGFPARQP